jgi:hypothetical protein
MAAAEAVYNHVRTDSRGSSSSSGGGGSNFLTSLGQQGHSYLKDLLAGTSRAMEHHAAHHD